MGQWFDAGEGPLFITIDMTMRPIIQLIIILDTGLKSRLVQQSG